MSIETLTGVSFLCLAAVLLLVERLPGMGRVPASIAQRWPTNLGLWLLSGILSAAIYSESTTVIATTFLALILVFAPGFSALALYLLLATLSAVYTHANIVLPESFDKPIRWLLVTPSVHAIHHSSFQPQTDSNYSSVLTLWDRLFGTYRDPSTTQVREYGLEYFRGHEETALAPVLLQPFEYRRDIHNVTFRPEAQSPSTSIAAPLGRDWRVALSYAAAGLLLALIALWPTVIDLSRVWMNSEPYQYAWLVLPTFIYVVGWYHRDAIISLISNLLSTLHWC